MGKITDGNVGTKPRTQKIIFIVYICFSMENEIISFKVEYSYIIGLKFRFYGADACLVFRIHFLTFLLLSHSRNGVMILLGYIATYTETF